MAVERFPQGRVGGVYDTVLDRLVETSETHFGVGAFSHEVGDTPVAAFGAAAGAIMTAPLGRLDTPIIDVQHPRSRCAGRGGQSMRQCAVAANQAAEKRRSRVEAQPSSGRSARHEQRLNCRDALIIDDPRRFVGDDCFGAFAPAGLPIDGVELSHSCIRRAGQNFMDGACAKYRSAARANDRSFSHMAIFFVPSGPDAPSPSTASL